MNTAHPWHGVSAGSAFPEQVTAYIEITPFDTVKYELDKVSGLLKIDRPQKFSNLCPALYGFVPQTYCGDQIGRLCSEHTGTAGTKGDGDPLDICILSEKPINCNNILIDCIPVGGLRMIDKNEADDKIIAVMKNDLLYGNITDITEIPDPILQRLIHYFKTYKLAPSSEINAVEIASVYGREMALKVLKCASEDYKTLKR
ncbi:MAG: inorganic pyrophosphatase [Chitinophagaceae bacterium]